MDIINYIKNNDFYNFKKNIDEDKSIINFNDNCLIQHCCEQNRYIFVKYLVENGADIHCCNDSPLEICLFYGYFDIIIYLLSKGCEITEKVLTRNDLIGILISKKEINTIIFIIEHGISYNDIIKISYLEKSEYEFLNYINKKLRIKKLNKIYNNKKDD